MRSSRVTMAYQSAPWVKATASAPSGRVMTSGNSGPNASEKRMTNSTTMTMNPRTMVAVSTVTRIRRYFTVPASTGVSRGVSFMGSAPLSFRVAAAPPPRLDKALSRDVPEGAALSRTRLARLIAAGCVRVNGQVAADAKARVTEGDLVEIALPEAAPVETRAEAIALSVLHEDAELIVVDKPAGMVVHPAPGSPGGTLVNALLHHCGDTLSGFGGARRPGIVHRIDKDTTGLLVAAKTDRAHHGLAEQFAAHSVERKYLALTHGAPEAGDPRLRGVRGVSFEAGSVLKITTGLARHRTDRQRQAVVFDSGRHAI